MELQPAPTVRAPRAMVCSADGLATQAGIQMLQAGGNAADAAIAANAVLAVTSPHLCGLGGDLWAMVCPPGEVPIALNASGRAGSGADADQLRAEGHTRMPLRGDIRTVTIPGCVDGWLAVHGHYGRLPLGVLLQPAIDYAEHGFPASPTLAGSLPDLADDQGHDVGAAKLRAGTRVTRRPTAKALRALVEEGRAGFYAGDFGTGLIAIGRGLYTEDDLARPNASWERALSVDVWGHTLWTVPPNSQGYLTLAATWIAESLDLPADTADPLWAHLLIEAARQASFDRNDVLFEDADGDALLDGDALAPRLGAIDPLRASTLGGTYTEGDTTAICVVDKDRFGVTFVQSNAWGFGSHLVEPSTETFLHNRGLGFSLQPGHPAEYGPGKRPPHTLSPAAVTTPDGKLKAVLGTAGADSQPQILLQLLARWLHNHQTPGPALAAGRWILANGSFAFSTWEARGKVTVELEGHAPDAWRVGLQERGHTINANAPFDARFGHAQLITVEGDHLAGATDPRPRGGTAAGI